MEARGSRGNASLVTSIESITNDALPPAPADGQLRQVKSNSFRVLVKKSVKIIASGLCLRLMP